MPTTLQRRLDRPGKRQALIAGVVVALDLPLAMGQSQLLASAALAAIALAVAAIPEVLPARLLAGVRR